MLKSRVANVATSWRPKYTLRIFLILFTVVCIWIGLSANRARRHRMAIEGIEATGGSVAYESEISSLPNRNAVQNYISQQVMRRSVLYAGSSLQTDCVKPASSRDNVSVVCATNVRQSDVAELIEHVNTLPTVEILVLSRMNIDDEQLRMLEPNPKLRQLVLDGNAVTNAGLKHLDAFRNLRTLSLLHNSITSEGLQHLAKMNHLERLNISADGISDESIALLKQTLPNCHIFALRMPATKRSWWMTATEDDDPPQANIEMHQ